MSLFIQTAHAAAQPAQQSPLPTLIMMLVFAVIFYFMIWRPQAKRTKEHRNMIDGIKEGNEVVFAGGLMGKVKKLDGEYAVVSLNERSDIMIQKASVISVLTPGTIDGLK